MKRQWLVVLALAGAVLLGVWLIPAMRTPRVVLDVPQLLQSDTIEGRASTERQEGMLYWASCEHPQFTDLDVASLEPHGRPVIVSGRFRTPVRGRSRAMQMLGTEDSYQVVNRAPGAVLHAGGPFAEFTLFGTSTDADEYDRFFAATQAGLLALP